MEELIKSIDLICQSRQLLPQNLRPILQIRLVCLKHRMAPNIVSVHKGKITLALVSEPLWLRSIVYLLCEKLAWLFIVTKLYFENNLFNYKWCFWACGLCHCLLWRHQVLHIPAPQPVSGTCRVASAVLYLPQCLQNVARCTSVSYFQWLTYVIFSELFLTMILC